MPVVTEAPTTTALSLKIPPEITQIETVEALTKAATPYFEKASPLCTKARQIVVTDVADKDGMALARSTRLSLKSIRVEADKTRKALKEESLRKGQAIDKIFNGFGNALEAHEEYLAEQEQYAERREQLRLSQVRTDREMRMRQIGLDPSLYQIMAMTDMGFVKLLDDTRLANEARAKQAEHERLLREQQERANAHERERSRRENDRLRQEVAQREEAIRVERQQAEHKRLAAEAHARAEREAYEARVAAERRAAEHKASQERQARMLAEAELAAKRRQEAEATAAEERARVAAARAPDKEKLLQVVVALRSIPVALCSSDEGIDTANDIAEKIAALADWIVHRTNAL